MTAVESLTWRDVDRRLGAGAFAILPVGAGAKEHGLHLPMATDRIQAEWLAGRLAEKFDALVWPTLAYGHYPAFVDYPGSASLSEGLFEQIVSELTGALLGYAPRGVVILNTGISTIPGVERAVSSSPEPGRVLHLKIHDGRRYREAAARLATQRFGGHADQLETARMLALAPHLVAMDRAEPGPAKPPGPGPLQRSDPGGPNYSASGVIGDPRGATLEVGEELLAAMVDDLVEAVGEWRARRRPA